jgi:hypothetical protein
VNKEEENEVTFIEGPDVYVCNNCGSYHKKIEAITHAKSCKPGQSEAWRKYYNHKEDGYYETKD